MKKGETPEAFGKRLSETYLLQRDTLFNRHVVMLPLALIESYAEELLATAKLIGMCELSGRWPRHHPGNRIGGCAFFPLCARGEGEELFVTRPAKNLFPELELEEAE